MDKSGNHHASPSEPNKLIIIIIIKMWQYPQTEMSCKRKWKKMLKYKRLCIEISGMWNLKYKIIPVINGAAGIATKGLRKNFEAIPGKHSVDSLTRQLY